MKKSREPMTPREAEILTEFEQLMDLVKAEKRPPTLEEQQRAAALVEEFHEVKSLH